MTQTTDHSADEVREVDLAITGMTCASCSARIEKKLGKLDGVDAVVNLATEKATVRWSGAVTVEDLLQTVRRTGYGAEVIGGPMQPAGGGPTQPAGGAPTQPAGGAPTQPAGGAPTQPAGGPLTQPAGGSLTQPAGGAPTQPASGPRQDPTPGLGTAAPQRSSALDAAAPQRSSDLDAAAAQRSSVESPEETSVERGAPGGESDDTTHHTATDRATHHTATAGSAQHTATDGTTHHLTGAIDPSATGDPADAAERAAASTRHHQVARQDVLRRRAVVASLLTLPLVVIAMWPGLDVPAEPWVQLALATPVVLWAGWPFHRAAALNARHGASTMDTLVSLGVLAAYLSSLVVVVRGTAATGMSGDGSHLWFETATVVTTFLLIGRWMEARATDRTRDSLRGLLTLGAKEALVVREDPATGATTKERIPIERLAVGDRFVVRPGEKVATDGTVLDGRSAVDTSLVTGESLPVDVEPGDEVTGGTVNTTGRLLVEATRVGSETTLAGIARLVERAQTSKAPVQRLADRVSAVFVPIVLVLAVATFAAWWLTTGDPGRALEVGIAVLVIACPCALGLATPTALLVGTGRGARLGILIKGADVLEDTRRVDTVVLDKTGTVTTGQMTLVDVATAGRLPKDQALRAAAAVESGSEHPVAAAVVAAATARGLDVPETTDFEALPGAGARAALKGTTVTVGRADLFDEVPPEIARPTVDGTTVWVGWDGRARASLTVADAVRRSSARAVRDLGDAGLATYLLTGDHDRAALSVARDVGIPAGRVVADVRPEDKHAMVAELQSRGKVVAMVGDGVNDAAALARADLGIAMGTGTDVAAEAADIVLLRADLPAVVDSIALSRATLRTIKQNLGWAFGYNVAAIPLAMAGLLSPMVAGAAMAMSSVLVVTNSLRLRRWTRSG